MAWGLWRLQRHITSKNWEGNRTFSWESQPPNRFICRKTIHSNRKNLSNNVRICLCMWSFFLGNVHAMCHLLTLLHKEMYSYVGEYALIYTQLCTHKGMTWHAGQNDLARTKSRVVDSRELLLATRDGGEQSRTKVRSIGSSTGATGASNVSSSGKIHGPKNNAILKANRSNVCSLNRKPLHLNLFWEVWLSSI